MFTLTVGRSVGLLAGRRLRGRRVRLAAALIAAAAATVVIYASTSSAARVAATRLATVKIALDYTENVDYLGIYVAKSRGYFAAEHINAVVLPYANASAEQLIQAGQTDLGISYPPDIIINSANGLRYKAVGALVSDLSLIHI